MRAQVFLTTNLCVENLLKKLNESCGFVYSTKRSDGKIINEKMLTDLFPSHAEIAFTKQTR